MSFEFSGNHISENKKESKPFDEQWYERFEKIGEFKIIGMFNGDKDWRENQKFYLNQKIENPKLDYPELENFDFNKKEEELLTLKVDVLKFENNEIVKQIYRWKINEKIASVRMLRCSKEGDSHRFKRY